MTLCEKTYQYKGYTIGRLTRNNYTITPPGATDWVDMWGHYPKTLKAAKAIVDDMEATSEKKG